MPPECYGVLSGQVNEARGGPNFQFSLPADGTHSEIGLPQPRLRSPSHHVVGEKIRDIVESGSWQLRHLAGPDVAGLLSWRASLTDEKWVDWGARLHYRRY